MAKVHDNPILDGLTGKLGKKIFIRRGRGGRTIVGLRTAFPAEREYNDTQLAQQEAFKKAAAYAKTAKDQPLYVALSKGKKETSYNRAVADWFGKPEVLEIDASEWTGKAGETINVRAQDDSHVTRVYLQIDNGNGTTFEQGIAERGEGLWWRYTTQTAVSLATAPRIVATARDLPGNTGEMVWQNN